MVTSELARDVEVRISVSLLPSVISRYFVVKLISVKAHGCWMEVVSLSNHRLV